jgi:hypothetical protein
MGKTPMELRADISKALNAALVEDADGVLIHVSDATDVFVNFLTNDENAPMLRAVIDAFDHKASIGKDARAAISELEATIQALQRKKASDR